MENSGQTFDGLISFYERTSVLSMGVYVGDYTFSSGIHGTDNVKTYLCKITNPNNDYNIIIAIASDNIASYNECDIDNTQSYNPECIHTFDDFIQMVGAYAEDSCIVDYILEDEFNIITHILCDEEK